MEVEIDSKSFGLQDANCFQARGSQNSVILERGLGLLRM